MLKVDMLQAGHGDALLVEYGEPGDEHRILIDGGPWYAYGHPGGLRERLLALLAAGKPELELLVVTHVDSDHIDGVIRLLQDPKLAALVIKDIWFNGWKHIKAKARGTLAGKHGEYLGALLETKNLPWNRHELLEGGPVVVPEAGDLPVLGLAGDATITLLSPGPAELEKLRREWPKSLSRAGFKPGDVAAALEQLKHRDRYGPPKAVLGSKPDDSAATASSIAFLLSHGDDRVLLAGDAHPQVLVAALGRWAKQHGKPPEVRDFKISHHGSYGNQSKQLMRGVLSRRYLISSSSAFYGHPDQDTIRLILRHGRHGEHEVPELVFNYLSPSSEKWADPDATAGYRASFPSGAVWKPPKKSRKQY